MDSAEHPLTLRVRKTDGTTIEHEAADRRMSIGDLKQSLAPATQIPRERIRLMLDNIILDDARTLEDYGIDGRSELRMVRLARGEENRPRNVSGIISASAPRPSPHQAFNNQARQMFLANPQLAQTMMMANPQMREALENNSELRQLMSDPEIMQQSLNAAQNPRLMQEVQRNNDRALFNLEASPGGFAQIRRMYQDIQEPLARASDSSFQSTVDELNRRRARVMGVSRPDTARVNTTPLPNPWVRRQPRPATRPGLGVRNPLAMVDQVSRNADRLAQLDISTTHQGRQRHNDDLLALLAQSGAGSPHMPSVRRSQRGTAARPGTSGEQQQQQQQQQQQSAVLTDGARRRGLARYHDMLEQLEEMGFADKDKNLRALIAADGDLDQAINIIAGEDGS